MTMPAQNQDAPDAPQDPQDAPEAPDAGTDEGTPDTEPTDAPEDLGDKGKQALDRMKTERNAARRELRELKARLEALEAPKPPEGQPDVEAIKREARAEAQAKANDRLLRAEVKAAAAGKLADPQDALRLLDLTEFEVDDEGNVDTDEIAGAIEGLLSKKPYLSAQGGKRFQGGADGGARKGSQNQGQLTKADLAGMSPEQIIKAQADGRLVDLGYK